MRPLVSPLGLRLFCWSQVFCSEVKRGKMSLEKTHMPLLAACTGAATWASDVFFPGMFVCCVSLFPAQSVYVDNNAASEVKRDLCVFEC